MQQTALSTSYTGLRYMKSTKLSFLFGGAKQLTKNTIVPVRGRWMNPAMSTPDPSTGYEYKVRCGSIGDTLVYMLALKTIVDIPAVPTHTIFSLPLLQQLTFLV